ncbi:GNAT family N-acetyltransferase [Deinococcus peraridilitoris]|uniref:Acetyltransferase n=1 Tax=Deinococcus peraridilitoris (strain DSM 19664 / LMG 22246 / CIP 109416 / KR-200) TaxID=937777 RepID=L0A3A9_DEIPD|nr:GNAT family N-acetyltransferase [Deinococcus peraridilitoris]AFZ68383.1 acetyltransferase [Deinococcus peraridilitoris DSM 19664]
MARVRRAGSEDAGLMAALTRQCWAGSVPGDSSAHFEDETRVLSDLASGGGLILEHGVIAVASLRWRDLPPGASGPGRATPRLWEVCRLGVLPHHRQHGHGERLMREVEALAASGGVPEVRLAVRRDASVKLVQFYQRLGYTIDPALVYSHANPQNPTPIVMRKELLHAMGVSA